MTWDATPREEIMRLRGEIRGATLEAANRQAAMLRTYRREVAYWSQAGRPALGREYLKGMRRVIKIWRGLDY